MKKIHRITTALLLSMILVIGGGERCSAVVNDNVLNSGLELKVGVPSNDGETIFSLLHQILTELAYVRNAVTSDESVSNADLKELIIGNYSSDKLCTQPTIVEARGYNNHLTVTWTKPTTTNVAVAKYNVYICPSDTAPLDLTDFTKIGTVSYNEFENNFTYVSPELLPNVNYWVMVTSESKRGVNNDQLVLNGSHIMKCVDKSAIASNIFTITEENDTITSCYTTQTFNYILNIPEKINGKTVVGIGSPDGNNATVAAGNFRDIVLPDTLTKVNSYFLNSKSTCLNLGISKDNCDSFNRYDKLPDAVTDVGDYAFNAETGLKDSNLILPTSLVNIGAYAYSNTKIATVKFTENTLQRIGNSAFENCTQINTVYVPNILEFGEIAFKGCTGLINLECNATTLTTQFQNCPALQDMVLDESVSTLGSHTFDVDIGSTYTTFAQVAATQITPNYGFLIYYDAGGWVYQKEYTGANGIYPIRGARSGGDTYVDTNGWFALNHIGNVSGLQFFKACVLNTPTVWSYNSTKNLYVKGDTLLCVDILDNTVSGGAGGNVLQVRTLRVQCPLLPSSYSFVPIYGSNYYCCAGCIGSAGFGAFAYEQCYSNSNNGNSKINVYSNDYCYDTDDYFSAYKYTTHLKQYSKLNLGWLADQFIEQHDINDVDVPSFK